MAPAIRGKIDYDNVVPKSILKNNVNNPAENGNKGVRFNDNVEEFPFMDFNKASYAVALNTGELHLDDNFNEDIHSTFSNLNKRTRKTRKPLVNIRNIEDELTWNIIVELNQAGVISDKFATMLYDPEFSAIYKLVVCEKFIEAKGHDSEMQPLVKYYTYKMHVLKERCKRDSKEKYIYDRNQILKYISGSDDDIMNSVLGELYNESGDGNLSIRDNIASIISTVDGIWQLKNQFGEYYKNNSELIEKVSKYVDIIYHIMTIQLENEDMFSDYIINDMKNIIKACKDLMQI